MRSRSTLFFDIGCCVRDGRAGDVCRYPRLPLTETASLGAADYCPNPVVHTLPAREITEHTAVLRGEVNPNGAIATCFFEYGKTKSYGSVTPNQHIAAGMKTVQLTAKITGLQARHRLSLPARLQERRPHRARRRPGVPHEWRPPSLAGAGKPPS